MDAVNLLRLLTDYFSDEELQTLCFRLSVDYDILEGKGKEGKARGLIIYLKHRERLVELVEQIRHLRPNLTQELQKLGKGSHVPETPLLSPMSEGKSRLHERESRDILEKLSQKRLVLCIGADLAEQMTGLPSRQMLAETLAKRERIAQGQRLAAVTQQMMSHGERFTFTDFLRQALNTSGKSPQPFHRHIVDMVHLYQIQRIITTAYDDLLELAFRQAGIELNRVVTEADLNFIRPDFPTLIKLYGDWQQVDTLVVTDRDQNTLLLGRDKPEIVNDVRQTFRRHTVLFLGCDLSDMAFISLFDSVAGDRFQLPSYAVWTGLTPLERESFKSNRHLTILETDPLLLLTSFLGVGA